MQMKAEAASNQRCKIRSPQIGTFGRCTSAAPAAWLMGLLMQGETDRPGCGS